MELKENTKRNGKTNRKNPFKHKSFHEIISWDQQYSIPQEIQWDIEQRLDSGIFKLAQHFDTVVMVTFQGNSFKKLPPHVLTNKSTFSHAGNEHNLCISNEKSHQIYYYHPTGKKYELLHVHELGRTIEVEASKMETPNYKGLYECKFCKLKFRTKHAYLCHKTSNLHFDKMEQLSKHKDELIEGDPIIHPDYVSFTKDGTEDYLKMVIKVNKNHYYSKNEFRKCHYGGCKCCIRSSSSALTKGYGHKSARKTKGRQQREKFLQDTFQNLEVI